MRQIAIFGNTYQQQQLTKIATILQKLVERGAKLLVEESYAQFLTQELQLEFSEDQLITDTDFSADLALSIGGDGTFLHTACHVGRKEIPIIGINTGRLGFLADVSFFDLDQALEDIYNKRFIIENRTLLELEIENYEQEYQHFALNEVSVLKRDNSSMISIKTLIDESPLNNYEADGLIIATPTGSTAYSLSVGGPILEPDAQNFIITPVAAHSLTTRPLVIKDSSCIEIKVNSRSQAYQVSIDGRSYNLSCEHRLFIKKADYSIGVIKRHGHTFYETLRNKLLWGADRRI